MVLMIELVIVIAWFLAAYWLGYETGVALGKTKARGSETRALARQEDFAYAPTDTSIETINKEILS